MPQQPLPLIKVKKAYLSVEGNAIALESDNGA